MPLGCRYQYGMANEAVVSSIPTSPYNCSMGCQSTRRSLPSILGLRQNSSASGASYARATAVTESVKRLVGSACQTFSMVVDHGYLPGNDHKKAAQYLGDAKSDIGQNSLKLPAGKRYATVFSRLSNSMRPHLTRYGACV